MRSSASPAPSRRIRGSPCARSTTVEARPGSGTSSHRYTDTASPNTSTSSLQVEGVRLPGSVRARHRERSGAVQHAERQRMAGHPHADRRWISAEVPRDALRASGAAPASARRATAPPPDARPARPSPPRPHAEAGDGTSTGQLEIARPALRGEERRRGSRPVRTGPDPYTVSVGITMSSPRSAAPIASCTGASHGRRATTTRSRPPRSGWTRTAPRPASTAAAETAAARVTPRSPPPRRHPAAASPRRHRTAAGRRCTPPNSASSGSASTSAGRDERSCGLDVRRVADHEVHAAPAAAMSTGSSRSPEQDRDLGAEASRRSRAASRTASGERSVATTRAPGCSSAIASAIAPVPVPTSTTTGRARSARTASACSTTTSVSGLGTKTPGRTTRVRWRNPSSPVRCCSGVPVHRRQSARPNVLASAEVRPARRVYSSTRESPSTLGEQGLGGGHRAGNVVTFQIPGRPANDVGRQHRQSSCVASCSARSAFCSASTNPSRLPARTSWSWWTVSLIR